MHFSDARCDHCARDRANDAWRSYQKKIREEARRYRILMALSPYGSFEELLRAIRIRQPRTRAQRYDLALERRCST